MRDYSKKYWYGTRYEWVPIKTAKKQDLVRIVKQLGKSSRFKKRILKDIGGLSTKSNRTNIINRIERNVINLVKRKIANNKTLGMVQVKRRYRINNPKHNIYHAFNLTGKLNNKVEKRVNRFLTNIYADDWNKAKRDFERWLNDDGPNKYMKYADKLANPLYKFNVDAGDFTNEAFQEWAKDIKEFDESAIVQYLRHMKRKMGFQDMPLNQWIKQIIDEKLIWTDDENEAEIMREMIKSLVRSM